MNSKEILEKYLNFYKEKNHKQVSNVSLVPQDDSTLLFVNSGMFPLVPYLSGEPHPLGKRLVNFQRCLRFDDIEQVGNYRHTVSFHMIGNWSLGDYFKKEQLPWAYEFLIKELGLKPEKLFATVFEGDQFAPKDEESIEIIKEIFKSYGIDAKEGERIFPCGRKSNWWQRGDTVGELGGPDSELFYYLGEGDPVAQGKNPEKNEEEILEIGNSVFMQYKKTETGWEPLAQRNVDFGGGLERIAMVVQGKSDIFETDNFWPLIEEIQKISKKDYHSDVEITKAMRILADHVRAAAFLAMDGVVPGNKDQGYVLRRILRRMVRAGKKLDVQQDISSALVGTLGKMFDWLYPDILIKQRYIEELFSAEESKFKKTLEKGSKEVEKILYKLEKKDLESLVKISFDLYQSFGYPVEIFSEDLKDRKIEIDQKEFLEKVGDMISKHQELSRSGAEHKFKGGLADQSDTVVKYHTTTHLLQKALKTVIGDSVSQIGSNITGERLRFDFPLDRKLSEQEIGKVEGFVKDVIEKKLPVKSESMPKQQAIESGALYIKTETYPDEVKVYYIGEDLETAVSKEMCGGPHVSNTSELQPIEIFKQESIGGGKMRVYARFI